MGKIFSDPFFAVSPWQDVIATGLLIAALHHAGLSTLTHTPSPMGFLNDLLGRGRNEMPYLLLVVGYPAPGCRVPDIARLPLADYANFL